MSWSSSLHSIWGILSFTVNSAAAPTLPQGAQEVALKPTDDEKPYLS